jgi:hypothetical protein
MICWVLASGCGRAQTALAPKHVEAPDYDRTANLAHIQGEILVKVTVNADGNVEDAHATGVPMLAAVAATNARLWTFEKPRHAPFEETLVYEYKMEGTGGCEIEPARVSFDFPNRVNIIAQPVHTCDPSVTIVKKR